MHDRLVRTGRLTRTGCTFADRGPKQNTPYVAIIYTTASGLSNWNHQNPLVRTCFKTAIDPNINIDVPLDKLIGGNGCFGFGGTQDEIRRCLCGRRDSDGQYTYNGTGNYLGIGNTRPSWCSGGDS